SGQGLGIDLDFIDYTLEVALRCAAAPRKTNIQSAGIVCRWRRQCRGALQDAIHIKADVRSAVPCSDHVVEVSVKDVRAGKDFRESGAIAHRELHLSG